MFSGNSTGGDDARHQLLGHEDDHEVGWEQQSVRSERNTASDSELWEQDPLSEESNELRQASHGQMTPTSSHAPSTWSKRPKPPPEDHGVAGTDLEAEFERIFSPVKHDQEERARFHRDLDAACGAYSARREEMKSQQRKREEAIEKPWLVARRRREWERAVTAMKNIGLFATCFWGGTVARFNELPPQIAWPPPHLTRMREHHAEERKALSEAHLAVVHELRVKYGFDLGEGEGEGEGEGQPKYHVCVERRPLQEVLGGDSMELEDVGEESRDP